MPTFKKILRAFGVKSAAPPKPKPAPKHNSVLPPSEREALIANAMALYRKNAAAMRGVIEGSLKQLNDNPPKPSDYEGLTRLLSVRQAYMTMRRLMNHRDKRYLVLVGLRELLEQKGLVAPPGVKKLVVKH